MGMYNIWVGRKKARLVFYICQHMQEPGLLMGLIGGFWRAILTRLDFLLMCITVGLWWVGLC